MKKVTFLELVALLILMIGCDSINTIITPTLSESLFNTTENPPTFPGSDWEKVSNPEKYNWSVEKLKEVKNYAGKIKTDALMIIDDGKLIAAYGEASKKYYVASIRKSFLSILYGYYIDKEISIEATIKEYEIDDKNPTLNEAEKSAQIKYLLNSTSGIYHKSAANDDNSNLPSRNSTKPGEKFYYNNWDFNALGTVFTKKTSKNIFEEFKHRIAKHIGMQDFNWQKDGRLDYSEVSLHPAYHFDMTVRDMARFGLLIMNKGKWNNNQLIPEKWITESTTPKTSVGADLGGGSYGYMWWLHDSGEIASAGFSKTAFSAQGNWSQLILVDSEKKLVIVHRAFKKKIDGEKLKNLLRKILASKI